jgi:N-acetylglucosamine-6-phosphate deacetylase
MDELCHNLIKLADIAPDVEGAFEFIDALKGRKVISIAHSNADYNTAKEAFQRGASHVTHLYNAMPPLLHRDPGVIGAAVDAPDCRAEIICDGVHVHPSVVRATFKMFGDDRIIFISDSMMATGLPDGDYALVGQAVRVVGKKAVLINDGAIAGSATNLFDCMKNAVLTMEIPLETAVKCAAVNSAKEIGIYDHAGSITAGKLANILLIDKELNLQHVILKGKVIL